MRENWKRGAALCLSLSLCLGLSACRKEAGTEGFTTHDAEIYVDGLIQENYQGKASQEYMELVDTHREDVEALYEDGLAQDVQFFCFLYDIDDPSDKIQEEIRDLYEKIYQHVKYDIVSAARQEDGSFSVKLNVYPIDIAQTVMETQGTATKEFFEKYPQETLNTMRDSDYEKVEEEWARLILDLYQDALKETGNMAEKSISVQIEKNEEGLYMINSEDFSRLDALIVDYSNISTEEE